MANMTMDDANSSLDVISQCATKMSQNSEKTRTVLKELHHSVSAWSTEQRQIDEEHEEVCEITVARCEGKQLRA